MRKLVFILIAFIAAVTFIRVMSLDGPSAAAAAIQTELSGDAVQTPQTF
jgi:hypothetical protein